MPFAARGMRSERSRKSRIKKEDYSVEFIGGSGQKRGVNIILPGGVTHALVGCCIAAIIIPVTPTVPRKVKKPPLINLFHGWSPDKNMIGIECHFNAEDKQPFPQFNRHRFPQSNGWYILF